MKLQELLKNYEVELSKELLDILSKEYGTIKIPSKTEAKLGYISKKDLLKICDDIELSKELILIILKNLSSTYITSQQNNATESQKQGYKALNSKILKAQVSYNFKKTSPYKTILDILIKYNIIEKGKDYSVGNKSNEYKLKDTYFKKGIVKYKLKTEFLIKRVNQQVDSRLEEVLKCPIAKSQLLIMDSLTLPTEKEAKDYLIKLSKKGILNKKGKKIVYLNKGKREDYKDCVFIEDYLCILDYLKQLTVPIIESERGGYRVITAFNFLPSVLRPLCKLNVETLEQVDYSCLHPNIVQYIYGGSNKEMITHDKVSEYLAVDREVAKVGHLSFFNLPWEQIFNSPLFKYYSDNEPMMMKNIFESKSENGYKETSQNCFFFETELMRENIKELDKKGIQALYCFDALYVKKEDLEVVTEVMNINANKYGLLTTV